MIGPDGIKVLEDWQRAGSPTEHEVTLEVPESLVGQLDRGAMLEIPGLGKASVELGWELKPGTNELEPGRKIVRLDVTVEPPRYP